MPGFNINGSGGHVDAKLDIYRNYRWQIFIHNPYVNSTNIRWPEVPVLDVTIPSISFEVLSVLGLSMDYQIPKKAVFSPIEVTFYDYKGLQEIFEEWVKNIWTPSGGLFNGEMASMGIKGIITISLLDHNGKEERKYTVYGAWPKRITHSKLDMAADTLKTLSVEFVYDYYKEESNN